MSILAELYLEVLGNSNNFANVDTHRQNLVGQQQSKYTDMSNVGLDQRMGHTVDTPSVVKVDTKSTYHRDKRTCYLCNNTGHIARDCRVVKKPSSAREVIIREASLPQRHYGVRTSGAPSGWRGSSDCSQ